MIFWKLILLVVLGFSVGGCSTMKSVYHGIFGGGEPPKTKYTRFSKRDYVSYKSKRKYERMTKEKFEQKQLEKDKKGSLWVMEGQESYLFSQNMIRLPGDILSITLEGAPKNQLNTKVNVIQDLVEKSEKDRKRQIALARAEEEGEDPPPAPKVRKRRRNKDLLKVQVVPARIIERAADGNYRVKGSHSFMIGQKEYRVLVTGLVRPNDIANDSVVASNILDAKFDIVRGSRGNL